MYCTNCGKETSNTASFCPYCGVKIMEKIPEVQREKANQNLSISGYNQEEALPVSKKRNKATFLGNFLPFIHILSLVFIFMPILMLNAMAMPRDAGSSGASLVGIVVIGVIVMAVVGFPVIFCILGSRTGHKFNVAGLVSLIAYLISFFILPVISNKYEASGKFQVAEGIANKFGKELTPTQFEILANSSDLARYSDDIGYYCGIMSIMVAGVILFAILLFDMTLLRKNTAQMIMGSILSVFAIGMLYLDYRIFHSDSLLGRVAGVVLSKTGFSLSPFCLLIMLFAILPVITAYICNKKDEESK